MVYGNTVNILHHITKNLNNKENLGGYLNSAYKGYTSTEEGPADGQTRSETPMSSSGFFCKLRLQKMHSNAILGRVFLLAILLVFAILWQTKIDLERNFLILQVYFHSVCNKLNTRVVFDLFYSCIVRIY